MASGHSLRGWDCDDSSSMHVVVQEVENSPSLVNIARWGVGGGKFLFCLLVQSVPSTNFAFLFQAGTDSVFPTVDLAAI